jgi:two-component system chemotaxis sensor kinase CheA
MAGLVVDTFIEQKEIVLKSLSSSLKNVFAISGATILGDGTVSLVIEPNALIK